MPRLRGRALRDERLVANCPHDHGRTTKTISAIRLDGSTACMTVAGATDTEVFQAYVRKVLRPTLRPGHIVVMDNLAPRKNEDSVALITATGASVRFLPTYSPDINPIENMWIKVKASLRRVTAQDATN